MSDDVREIVRERYGRAALEQFEEIRVELEATDAA